MVNTLSQMNPMDAVWLHGCKMLALVALLLWSVESLADEAAQAQPPSEEAVVAQQRVSTILSDDANAPKIQGEQCLPARRIRSVDVLDSRTLVFDLGRDRNYLVRLERQCFGLRHIHRSVMKSLETGCAGLMAFVRWSTGATIG